jgi:formylglycine-generating enzyme required for sulfatase activity
MSKTALLFCLCWLLPLDAQERGIQPVSARLPSGQEIALYQRSYAVVVGVSDYDTWPDLPNAVRDAEEVAEALKNLGFEVRLVRDPDSQALERVLEDLEFQAGAEQDRLLFYFAGHGETETLADGGELGYIVPRDAPLKAMDERGFIKTAVSMQRLEQSALRMRFKHVLFVFDSCFSGSIFALQRAAPQNISEKVALPVRQFITAGGKGETVPDQSVFKTTLLAALEGHGDLSGDGYITGTELGLYLQEQVVNYSRGAQHPQSGKLRNPKLDKGDFVFVLEPGGQGASRAYQDQAAQYDDQIEKLKAEIEAEKRRKAEEEAARLVATRKRKEAEKLQRELELLRQQQEPKPNQEGAFQDFARRERAAFNTYVKAQKQEPVVRPSASVSGKGGKMVSVSDYGFYIDKNEVTNGQYAEFLNAKGNQSEGGVTWLEIESSDALIEQRGGRFSAKSGYGNHPVIEVSWYGAQAYCAWAGKRLPTEAEWQQACQGKDGRTYPWGNGEPNGTNANLTDANTSYSWSQKSVNDNYAHTAPVGSYPWGGSPYGALDMAGNVWEWTALAQGANRVLRGGSWDDNLFSLRCTDRLLSYPIRRYNYYGFRCAR